MKFKVNIVVKPKAHVNIMNDDNDNNDTGKGKKDYNKANKGANNITKDYNKVILTSKEVNNMMKDYDKVILPLKKSTMLTMSWRTTPESPKPSKGPTTL